MLSFLVLLAIVGGVDLSTLATAHQAPHSEAALPGAALGLAWRRHRDVVTARGPRTLWIGDGPDERYARAYKLSRDGLRDVGFSWGTAERSGGMVQPVCWEDTDMPGAGMDFALAAAEDALAEDDERLAAEAARQRRTDELEAALNGDGRRSDLAALRESLDTRRWAWSSRKRGVAEALLAEPPGPGGAPRSGAARLARDMTAEVEAAIAATRARAAEHPDQDWLARAEDPLVRDAVHAATRILTALDGDQATIRNSSGWGQSHSRIGHVLAGLDTLTVIEASHALAAVHRHRRQLPTELRLTIFGTEA
ncbi:hypothetical protein [Methylobacterium sp. yr668]|uniref:hypothetical protein n=1 Tax=Methylobacterium sp. yr668 TaxID=1761801 RepID=UPI0008EAD07D|nr:hypothetical protein [Methylobacterium sp. yr668]SFT30417.1 hypothetical protein SAMN04487845_1752 [Methylobacterium sp. yr668]